MLRTSSSFRPPRRSHHALAVRMLAALVIASSLVPPLAAQPTRPALPDPAAPVGPRPDPGIVPPGGPRITPSDRVERPPTGGIVIDRGTAADGRARPAQDRCGSLPPDQRALCLDRQDPHRAGEMLREPTQR
jgi:hypothetical protein